MSEGNQSEVAIQEQLRSAQGSNAGCSDLSRIVYPLTQPGGEAAGSQPAKRRAVTREDSLDVGERPARPHS